MQELIIEIATSDIETTAAAVEGGADRIELCSNLVEGGTTASHGLLRICREEFSLPIYPIIRPRGGDFLYSDKEFWSMLYDAQLCRDLGYEGIVTGLLRADGNIDVHKTKQIVQSVYPLQITFHRAFDRCRDPFSALEELIDLGCERILTSGQQPTVMEGVSLIKQLQDAAADRIIIMPGSGVRPDNIRLLKEATGCIEFHSSLRTLRGSKMEFVNKAFKEDSYQNNAIDVEEVRKLRAALNSDV